MTDQHFIDSYNRSVAIHWAIRRSGNAIALAMFVSAVTAAIGFGIDDGSVVLIGGFVGPFVGASFLASGSRPEVYLTTDWDAEGNFRGIE